MSDLDDAINIAHHARGLDQELVKPEARSGYGIINVPATGPNGERYAAGHRVYSDKPQAPGGLMEPGTLPHGDVVAHVDVDGTVTHGARGASIFHDRRKGR